MINNCFSLYSLLFRSGKSDILFHLLRDEEQVDKCRESLQKQTSPGTENHALRDSCQENTGPGLAVHRIYVNFLVAEPDIPHPAIICCRPNPELQYNEKRPPKGPLLIQYKPTSGHSLAAGGVLSIA